MENKNIEERRQSTMAERLMVILTAESILILRMKLKLL